MAGIERRTFLRGAAGAGAVAWAAPQVLRGTPAFGLAAAGSPAPGPGGCTIAPFSETWEQEACSLGAGLLANWDVVTGSIDVIGNGTTSTCGFVSTGAQNKVLDMDGNSSAIIDTKTTYAAGTYAITFVLGGSQRGDTNTIRVTFGTFTEDFALASSDPLTTFGRTATLTSPGKLRFDHTVTPSNTSGVLLGDVSIECPS